MKQFKKLIMVIQYYRLTQIEDFPKKNKIYNFNVLGYNIYVIGSELAVVNNDCHGNSLDSQKENQLYNLLGKDGNIQKIGETTRGFKRYSKKFLREKDLTMDFVEKGSKRYIHNLQHEKLIEFVKKYGVKPLLNKTLW